MEELRKNAVEEVKTRVVKSYKSTILGCIVGALTGISAALQSDPDLKVYGDVIMMLVGAATSLGLIAIKEPKKP